MPHQQTSNSNSPPSLFASWSLGCMTCGQQNSGQLTLQLTTKGASVALNSGDRVTLDLPSVWTVTTSEPGWSVSPDNTYLTWDGSGTFSIGDSSAPNKINVTVTPPANPTVGKTQISVQLEDSNGTALSQCWTIPFNLTLPSQPVVAFANDPSAAILTAADAIPFSNTLVCTLLNSQSNAVPVGDGAMIELSFLAQDASGTAVDISQKVKSDNLTVSVKCPSGQVEFHNDGAWPATLPQKWTPKFGPVSKLDFSGSAGCERSAEL